MPLMVTVRDGTTTRIYAPRTGISVYLDSVKASSLEYSEQEYHGFFRIMEGGTDLLPLATASDLVDFINVAPNFNVVSRIIGAAFTILISSRDVPKTPYILSSSVQRILQTTTILSLLHANLDRFLIKGSALIMAGSQGDDLEDEIDAVSSEMSEIHLTMHKKVLKRINPKVRRLTLSKLEESVNLNGEITYVACDSCKTIPSLSPIRSSLTALHLNDMVLNDFDFLCCANLMEIKIARSNVEHMFPFPKNTTRLTFTRVTGLRSDHFAELRKIEFFSLSECTSLPNDLLANIGQTIDLMHLEKLENLENDILFPCTNLSSLSILDCPTLTNIYRSAQNLKYLRICGKSFIGDSSLANSRFIEDCSIYDQMFISTVRPFARTLLHLNIGGACGVGDSGLRDAIHLKTLIASDNQSVTTFAPFANNLEDLNASGLCGLKSIDPVPMLKTLVLDDNPSRLSLDSLKQNQMLLVSMNGKCGAKLYKVKGRSVIFFVGELKQVSMTGNKNLDKKLLEKYVSRVVE